jgi:ABC-type enterochelin transport system ATPase subunit
MLLKAEKITGGYRDRTIIEAVNLAIDRGEWLSLVGANGSGKSTLLCLQFHDRLFFNLCSDRPLTFQDRSHSQHQRLIKRSGNNLYS